MKAAFYKGSGGLIDSTIRWATKSPYSHVEFVARNGNCISSSHRDSGVREKYIDLYSGNWDVVDLPFVPEDAEEFLRSKIGAKYDYKGILLAQMFGTTRHSEVRWFCSELVCRALKYTTPHAYNPGRLYEQLVLFNNWKKTNG